MMNQQSQGTGSPSADLPVKRKRGRPRKDDGQVQGDNTPVTPIPDSDKKVKQAAGPVDSAEDDMLGQAISGFVEGSFDAGYLLNVRVGNTDTRLRGLVFLPGRFIPITAANDVAPNVRMYTRKNIPIPVQNPQTQPGEFVPLSEPINKQATEVKIDQLKLPDLVVPSELQSGIPVIGENQSASVILPVADDLPKKETGPAFGETVPLQKVPDSGQESQTPAVVAQLKHEKTVEQDGGQQGTDMEIETTKESEPASAPLVDVTTSTGCNNQEPQVENLGLSSDLQANELVQNEVKDLNNEDNKTALTAEPESMLSEPVGISTLMEKPNLEDNQTPLFAEPESKPSGSIGISMLVEKPNLEDNQIPLFAEPETMPPESTGISMLMEKPNLEENQTPVFAEPESMPSVPIGIGMLMEKPNLEGNQTALFAEPESLTSEPMRISILMEKTNLEHNQNSLFAESKPLSPEPAGINFHVEKQTSPKKDTQDAPSELAYPVEETTNTTTGGSYCIPMTNLSVMLFEEEAAPSQPSRLENEGPPALPPRMLDTTTCSSSTTTNNGNAGIKDAIATSHLESSSGLNPSESG